MQWRIDNNAPIYAQLIAQIKRAIVSGALSPGERLASVRDLAMEAGVNPNTMQRALAELERDGLVYTQRTSGRFVTEDLPIITETRQLLAEEEINRFLMAIRELGLSLEDAISLLRQHTNVHQDTRSSSAAAAEES